ncbi:MAG: hypothetical protein ACRC6T_08435 [Sarcina sp.]
MNDELKKKLKAIAWPILIKKRLASKDWLQKLGVASNLLQVICCK